MARPPEHLPEDVREWLIYAEADLQAAVHLMTMPGRRFWLVTYHAQQSAEKALKGFLALSAVDFPFTHNIGQLRQMCEPHAEWAAGIVEIDVLTRYATTARYPGIGIEASEEEGHEAVRLAQRTLDLVKQSILGGQP